MLSEAARKTPEMIAYLGPILTGDQCEPIVRQVPVAFLDVLWPDVVDLLGAVAERSSGRLDIKAIAGAIISGGWQLWVIWDGRIRCVLATEITVEATGQKNARIVLATGNGASQWVNLIGDIEEWARSEGCRYLEMTARKGWARYLKAYRMTHVLLERDLQQTASTVDEIDE